LPLQLRSPETIGHAIVAQILLD